MNDSPGASPFLLAIALKDYPKLTLLGEIEQAALDSG